MSPRTGALLGAVLLLATVAAPVAAQQAPPAATPNIILVAFDTTRADHLGAYGYDRDTSPSLDRFAQEAVLFEHCYGQSNETLTAFASLFTSRYPSEIAPLSYETFVIPDTANTLPKVLQLYGYQTGGFVAGAHLVGVFGHSRGFDLYRDEWHFGSFYHTVPPALDWLDARDTQRPFFLFVHSYDAHAPYAKPLYFEGMFDPDYQGPIDDIISAENALEVEKIWHGRYYAELSRTHVTRVIEDRDVRVLHTDLFSLLALQDPATATSLQDRDLDHVVAHYDGSIAYADMQFGLLIDRLRERGLLDSSIIIVMGDHGEDLFEHGHANHRISLHDASGHVPLIVRFPNGEHGGQRIAAQVELLDVMPTVLELAGAVPPAGMRGHSLMPLVLEGEDPERPTVSISEGIMPMGSVRGADHRLIVNGILPGSPEFMGLLASGDIQAPQLALFREGDGIEERMDLSQPEGARVATELLEAMRLAYEDHARLSDDAVPYIDPALQEIMRDKGYW
jgi:arylsulfatase A-like enzyme